MLRGDKVTFNHFICDAIVAVLKLEEPTDPLGICTFFHDERAT